MVTLPDDFFTIATFGTLAGSVGITTLVTAAIHRSFGWSPAKTGLAVAFLVIIAGLFLADKIADAKADVVAFFNAFLVYMSAAGISDAAGTTRFRGVGARPWFRSWFH
jgi:Na+/alanine symporter